MAKGTRKGRCPRCGKSMKLKRRFCTSCGCANPMLAPRPVRRRTAAKSAGYATVAKPAGFAPVHDLEAARLWREVYAEPDPGQRQALIGMILKRSGAA